MVLRWLPLLCLPLLACSAPKTPTCDEGAACPPGQSCRDGVCAEPPHDAGDADGGLDAGDGGVDAGFDAGAPDAGDGGSGDAGLDAGPPDAGCGLLDAGNPPNLLENPGFECGDPPSGWESPSGSLGVETAAPRSGLQAARLVANAGSVALFSKTTVANTGVHRYCAAAWVRGAPSGATVRLSMSTLDSLGGLVESEFSAPLTSTWSRLHVDAYTKPMDDRVRLRVSMPSTALGDSLFVDDADLWVSADGGCLEH